MEDSETLSDLELGNPPPKLTFDELKSIAMKDLKQLRTRNDLLKTLFYYCKDSKKHSRIIKYLFWPLIIPFIQDKNNNKIALFGLKALNQLILNEGTHDQILNVGHSQKLQNNPNVLSRLYVAVNQEREDQQLEKQPNQSLEMEKLAQIISKNVDPIKILVKKILKTESTLIMNEATKAIKNLAKNPIVIQNLISEGALINIVKNKFIDTDPQSQEYILETVSTACEDQSCRQKFVEDDKFIDTLMDQIKSISPKVTYQTIKICRQLAKDEGSLERLQGNKLRLSQKLIYAFRWLYVKIDVPEGNETQDQQTQAQIQQQQKELPTIQQQEQQLKDFKDSEQNDLIFREISKTFQYILKYYDVHKNLVAAAQTLANNDGVDYANTENEIIDTIVQLGKSTKDPKTTLNSATSLAHITEILHCNKTVATDEAIDFMIDMLKDTKNLKHHRQGCRYFANLSFYREFRETLIDKEIATYLLKAIDGYLDEDTIKHSAIALGNLSSHKKFMSQSNKQAKSTTGQGGAVVGGNQVAGNEGGQKNSVIDKYKIKPLIHLLDSAKEGKINLIQSACITLCNMASKPSLHQHFIHEPEISTIKNCLSNPIDKNGANELTRFMIKLVCNLTKNPAILKDLSKKGFLETLFDLLNHEKEKEIFGNVVTAISYLSVEKECQEKIIKNKIIPRILEPLTQIHEVDQKLIVIALTSMLFNGIELQKEFIRHGGLGKLLFFMQQKDKIFQQLSCKCFSLLSENQENLQEIIDQECLNTIIISCLRTKDIDLETLKEITKIFINLILWRKLKKETIETTCYLCDIGLMIKDIDMNILAIFCLNALSENEHSHSFIKKSCIDEGGHIDDINASSSIFSRINFLLEYQESKADEQKLTEPQKQEHSLKQELLVILITSFYLNLARNEENIEFLLNLKLFKRLNSHMQLSLSNKVSESTALCYTNTIFAKLLKFKQSQKQCIEEEGYLLFIRILKSDNKHLYLETLDSIKLFLTKREYLSKFQSIPECMQLSKNCQDLNVSFLQVLAILSFEKQNHPALKKIDFLKKLEDMKMFDLVFKQFDEMVEEKKKDKSITKKKTKRGYNSEFIEDNKMGSGKSGPLQEFLASDKGKSKDKKKKKTDENREIELALAISIILANLSCEEDFIKTLLGVEVWPKKASHLHGHAIHEGDGEGLIFKNNRKDQSVSVDSNSNQHKREESLKNEDSSFLDVSQTYDMNHSHNMQSDQVDEYDDKKLRDLSEVKRITRLLNLLSHENPFISEQISILLANVSNSPYFRHLFITDRCMKALIKILRFDRKQMPTEVSLLAILIAVLNLSSLKEVVRGIENMKFLSSLEDIVKNDALPYVNKSIGLLAISNIYTLSRNIQISNETKEFAFYVLQTWRKILDEEKENIEVVKNLVYSSLILFYNLILKKTHQIDTIKKLIMILTEHILSFDDPQIINVVLELITLFTKDADTSLIIFKNKHFLSYAFNKLKSSQNDTVRLSALALSRLAARLDESNSELFIENLKEFKDFDIVVEKINQNLGQNDAILKYFLNFLENITSFKKTRDELDCSKCKIPWSLISIVFESTIHLYQENILLENKVSLINIMFNLNFNLAEPRILQKEFLRQLYKTYRDEGLQNDEKAQRKIIVLVVSASSLEDNHKNIIKCNFYTQFKKNINDNYEKYLEANEEIELFGLVNIALNKKYMNLIYQDLKKVHKIALKNPKIDFKTKVDLLSECSKFIARLSSGQPEKAGLAEKDISEMIEHCLKALLFSLIKLISLIDPTQFTMFKYFLTAILDTTKNLKNNLIYLIKLDHLLDFLKQVLTKDYQFQMKEFDDEVLNFSLRVIVCEIFFNLKFERTFFKREDMTEQIKLLIQFAQSVITMNIEKKMTLVSNTLRLLSQMIASIHLLPLAHEKILKTQAVEFVKEALTLSKDLQPCINIDALFCLTNMMNIKELSLDPSLQNLDTVNNALIIYFAYNHQVELDECIITFLYSISKYHEYQVHLKDKSKVLFFLMDKHLDASKEGYKDSCRKKIFSCVYNMTENEDICRSLNVAKFIQLTNKMLQQTGQNLYSADHIHEVALKSLINLCRHNTENLEEANLKELFICISNLYSRFKSLSKQYSLRLITILTKQWNDQKIQEYLVQIIDIISQFIERCDSVIEMKLVLLNLERISCFKNLMKSLAESQCEQLIKNISVFLQKSINKEDYANSIEQLLKFCKKLSSKSNKSHQHLVNYKIHEISLEYISKTQNLKLEDLGDKPLRQHLTAIQNVMKMIKNIYENCTNEEQKAEIFEKVSQKEDVINVADDLLQSHQNNDDLAIMIVNIIICFNSISNKLDASRVKTWVKSFSGRLVESAKPEFQKKNARPWYMEKYVFIIELLVVKNLDKIDKDTTNDILQILDIDQTYFTKTVWYKMIKILAHLQYLQEIANQGILENIFKFIIQAYEKAQENLCFYYFMKVILLIIKKVDNNALFKASKFYQIIFGTCVTAFIKWHQEQNDPLLLEILLYLIDFFKFLMNFTLLYQHLNNKEIVFYFIEMLQKHENNYIVKALTSSLLEASKITIFYPDLLNDHSLNIILNKIIEGNLEIKSLDNLYECIRNILLQTKVPVKFLIATSVLKITESGKTNWKDKEEGSIVTILKILHFNIMSLDDARDMLQSNDNSENFEELQKKALKYSLIAITNILIKSNPEQILNKRVNLIQLLLDNSSFQVDSQINLRFLYLLYISLDKNNGKDIPSETASNLINFLLSNIHKFRSILQMRESYFFEIPSLKLGGQQINTLVNPSSNTNNNLGVDLKNNKNAPSLKQREGVGIITVGGFDKAEGETKQSAPVLSISSNHQIQSTESLHLMKLSSNSPTQNATSVTSLQKNHLHQIDYFFFENDDFQLRKIDGIRLSLCMSIKILYKISNSKKRQNCQIILENDLSNELFKFFTPFIDYFDDSCLKQIRYVIKIIKNCAEIVQLHALLLQKEYITYLIKVIEIAFKYDFLARINQRVSQFQYSNSLTPQTLAAQIQQHTSQQQTIQGTKEIEKEAQERKRSVILPILRTFIFLSTTPEFHWHLQKYSTLDLLNNVQVKDDEKIGELAKEVCEKVIDHIDESILIADQDFHQELEMLSDESQTRQLKTLQNIESLLIQKKVKLDIMSNAQLYYLLKTLQLRIKEKEVSSDLLQTKKLILTIMNFVYNNKFLKESGVGTGTLKYKMDESVSVDEGDENDFILKEIRDEEERKERKDGGRNSLESSKKGQTKPNGSTEKQKQALNNSGNLVSCIIEQEVMFETLLDLVDKDRNFSDLAEKITELINSYTQSLFIRTDCLITYILPIYTKILSTGNYSITCFNFILESLVRLLKQQDMCIFILQNFDISQILNQVIQNEQYAFNENVFANLELVVKLIFYNPIKISKSSEQFIKALLEHQSSIEYNRLGLFSLYCLSLALQEQQYSQNLALFNEDSILKGIFTFVVQGAHNQGQIVSMIKRNSPDKLNINNLQIVSSQSQPQMANMKLKYIGLQILVNVLEFINQEVAIVNQLVLKSQTQMISAQQLIQLQQSQNLSQFYKVITEKIYVEFGLLQVLMKMCSYSSGNEFQDEKKLAARAFSSLPLSLVYQINPLVDLKMKESSETFTLLTYFQAINSILRMQDTESSYFALYALLNLITNLELPSPLDQQPNSFQFQHQHSISRDALSKLTFHQLDYSSLCAALIKSSLLQQILILPQKISDEDVIRVCLKLLITIMFKGQSHKILFLEGPLQQNAPNNQGGHTSTANRQQHFGQSQSSFYDLGTTNHHSVSIWDQLGIPIEGEREKSREQLRNLIQKLQSFELSQIHQGGYVQFLHLISQVLLTTTNNNQHLSGSGTHQAQHQDERNKLLPPSDVLAEIVRKVCLQMNEKEIFKIISGDDVKGKKLLLYKFFFFNYMLSVTIPDVVSVVFHHQHREHIQVFNEGQEEQKESNVQNNSEEQNAEDLPEKLFKSLVLMLDNLKDKNINRHLDQVMIQNKHTSFPQNTGAPTHGVVYHQSNKPGGSSKMSARGGGQGNNFEESKDGTPLPNNNNNLSTANIINNNQMSAHVDDSQSTTMSILRLILFNLEILLKQTLAFIGSRLLVEGYQDQNTQENKITIPNYLIIQESFFDTILSFLNDYEDNGDIVETCYTILDHYLRIPSISNPIHAQNPNGLQVPTHNLNPSILHLSPQNASFLNQAHQQNILILEKSKALLSIGIKHTAAYQCEQAYLFLKHLVSTSDKYKSKGEIEQALNSIIPHSLKQNPNQNNPQPHTNNNPGSVNNRSVNQQSTVNQQNNNNNNNNLNQSVNYHNNR